MRGDVLEARPGALEVRRGGRPSGVVVEMLVLPRVAGRQADDGRGLLHDLLQAVGRLRAMGRPMDESGLRIMIVLVSLAGVERHART